jgi:hypothetical protein
MDTDTNSELHMHCRILAPLIALTLTAAAADSFAASEGLPPEVRVCRDVADTGARLRCYDDAVDALDAAAQNTPPARAQTATQPDTPIEPATPTATVATPAVTAPSGPATADPATTTRAETPQSAEEAVGEAADELTAEERFGLSKAEARRQADLEFENDDLDLIESIIEKIRHDGYGKFVVQLENGQAWRQLDTRRLKLEVGDAVRINAAIFGSFLLEKSTGSRKIKVQRVE